MAAETPETPMAVLADVVALIPHPQLTARCGAPTKAGRLCVSPPLHGSDRCWMHSPFVDAEQRRAASRKGGETRRKRGFGPPSRVTKLPSAETLTGVLVDALAKVRSGVFPPKVGTAIAYMVNSALKAVSILELEERIKALEQAADSEKMKR